jgi:hypothetical protein
MQLLSGTPEVQDLIWNEIRNFADYNRLNETPSRNSFFGFENKDDIHDQDGGYNSIVAQSYRSMRKLDIVIRRDEESIMKFYIENIDSWYQPEENDRRGKYRGITVCRNKKAAKNITKFFQKRSLQNLKAQLVRGQSYFTLEGSPISSFFIGNCKAPVNDHLIRFVIRARNDTLWTKARSAMCNQSISPFCECHREGYANLCHTLNCCLYSNNISGMTI